jgi:hypothetical protein
MSNHRWSKFVWDDFTNDPAVRQCHLTTQAIWVHLLGLAHKATPRGYVLIAGKRPTPEQIVTIIGGSCSISDVSRAFSELSLFGVCSFTRGRVMYSRRMVRDEEAHEIAVSIGKKGGNPNLKRVNGGVNHKVNGGVNRPVKTESDSESESDSPKSPSASASSPASAGALKPSGTSRPRASPALIALVEREAAKAAAALAEAPGEGEPPHPFRVVAGGKKP